MERRTIKALIDAGAVKQLELIANGGDFYLEVKTTAGKEIVTGSSGSIKTWRTIDSAAKWLHLLGIGKILLKIDKWQPGQKTISL
jgi:hypothetical protein|tara:strand:+ start:664 stop:918 length:255 start_codon:yes stop_codon:yes gene_type:complete